MVFDKSEKAFLDPVFLKYGMKVYTYEYIQALRKENLERKRNGKSIVNLIPQSGFQENALLQDADIKIIGGRRGGGKTWIGLFEFLPYMFNPDVFGYGFRKFEDDIARGIWRSLRPVFKPFGTLADSYFSDSFLTGRGATFKCEHLQDPKKITDRFRGVEMAYILIEELAEHTRDSLNPLFDLLTSNRSTAGVKPKCVCTCNPVGKSNKLRYFLDWYIDPETDTIIPERDGKVRYFYRYGEDVTEIAWGDTPEEVYMNTNCKDKIDHICNETGQKPENIVTSLVFIEGGFQENLLLQAADPKYMNRISARGGESTSNDILGVWRDVDNGGCLVTADEMLSFFGNSERRDGTMRASADVALDGDFFVIYALDGRHICDMEAWNGIMSDDVVPFIEQFLQKNGVRKENFTFDANGLGFWLKRDSRFDAAVPFNNRSAPTDTRMWDTLKSECADKFITNIKHNKYSIDERILNRKLRDKKGKVFTVKDRLVAERQALKRKNNQSRFEIIAKAQMKAEVGHSPDFIEGLFMVEHLFEGRTQVMIRTGFESYLI